jgi:glutamate/tyrosine decarboxylase-like PLP-dependent enzyme
MPYGIGCTIVRDRLAHYSTFVYGHEAEYLKSAFDLSEDQLANPHNLALPLSRSFSSLKAYMLLRAHGKKKYSNLIQQNIDQTRFLAELIKNDPEMEITAPVVSNIVCFRFKPNNLNETELEELNKKILDDINERAFLMISDTTIKGKYMLRACNVNNRSRREDILSMYDEVKRTGEKNLIQMLSNSRR